MRPLLPFGIRSYQHQVERPCAKEQGIAMPNDVVFLLDVDNTLLDNDRVQQDLSEHLERAFGRTRREEYWEIFEALRTELGYSDYLGALQRYRLKTKSDPRLFLMSSFLLDYPFAE